MGNCLTLVSYISLSEVTFCGLFVLTLTKELAGHQLS